LARVRRPARELLLRVEEVPGVRSVALHERLLARQEVVDRARRDGVARRVDRGRKEGALEVEELELRGLADDLRGRLRVLDPRKLDHDLVRALLADLRLGDAQLVDTVAHDLDRAVEISARKRLALRRDRLEGDLEAALEVETERRAAMQRRSGHGEEHDAHEGRREQAD